MANELEVMIEKAIATVPFLKGKKASWRPLIGGILNSNWLIETESEKYFIKLFGAGTESFIDRNLASTAAKQAEKIGVGPKVLWLDTEIGFEIIEFLEGYTTLTNADFTKEKFLSAAIDIYKKVNSADKLPATKDVFEMADEHIEQGRELNVDLPVDFPWLYMQYQKAKSAFMASGLDIVPCHNDPMPGNFMVDMDESGNVHNMKMVDYEFASNNERSYEIGVFLGEMFVGEELTMELVERYYGKVRQDLIARVWVARAVADIKWGSWAIQQRKLSDWDFDYQKYGIWKYGRARNLFNDPRWDMWLRQV